MLILAYIILLFYLFEVLTPILFLVSVVIYSISQINKNLNIIGQAQKQRQNIETLQATLNAKTDVGATNAEITQDIKRIATTIQNAILEQFSPQNNQESTKEETRYMKKLASKQLLSQLTKLLQTKK